MGRVSGMEILSCQGLKKSPKISPRGEKNLVFPRDVSRPAGGKVLLSTGPSGNCIPERVEQTIFPVFALI